MLPPFYLRVDREAGIRGPLYKEVARYLTFKIGFSPRKASLSLYGMQGAPGFNQLIGQLGKHKLGAGCLYITNLKHTDINVLAQLIEDAWQAPLDR